MPQSRLKAAGTPKAFSIQSQYSRLCGWPVRGSFRAKSGGARLNFSLFASLKVAASFSRNGGRE